MLYIFSGLKWIHLPFLSIIQQRDFFDRPLSFYSWNAQRRACHSRYFGFTSFVSHTVIHLLWIKLMGYVTISTLNKNSLYSLFTINRCFPEVLVFKRHSRIFQNIGGFPGSIVKDKGWSNLWVEDLWFSFSFADSVVFLKLMTAALALPAPKMISFLPL